MCVCISPRLSAVHKSEAGEHSLASVSSVQHDLNAMVLVQSPQLFSLSHELSQWQGSKLNKAVPENPFLIPVVKSLSPELNAVMRRRGNFPSYHPKQSTSSRSWGGSTINNYKGLCADKLCPIYKHSQSQKLLQRLSEKYTRKANYGTVSCLWQSTQAGQLEMGFARRTWMEAQGHLHASYKYLSCSTGHPSQKAKDISIQEQAPPKTCHHQHRLLNRVQGGSTSNSRSEISLPVPGKIWLRYSLEQLLFHGVIAGYERKSINLEK